MTLSPSLALALVLLLARGKWPEHSGDSYH